MARYLLELDTLLQCLAMLLTCVVTGIARAGIGARQLLRKSQRLKSVGDDFEFGAEHASDIKTNLHSRQSSTT